MGACGSCSAKKDVVDTADVAIEDAKPVKAEAELTAAASEPKPAPPQPKKSASTISLGAEPDVEDAFEPAAAVGDFRPVSPSELKSALRQSGPSLIKLTMNTVDVTGGVRLSLKIEPLGILGIWLRVKRYFAAWPFRY